MTVAPENREPDNSPLKHQWRTCLFRKHTADRLHTSKQSLYTMVCM